MPEYTVYLRNASGDYIETFKYESDSQVLHLIDLMIKGNKMVNIVIMTKEDENGKA